MKLCFKICLFIVFTYAFSLVLTNSVSASTTIFQDDFNGPDGTPLSTHNSRWMGFPGVDGVTLLDNKARSYNSNAAYIIPDLVNLSNYCVQEDFVFPLGPNGYGTYIGLSTRGDVSERLHHYFSSINDQGYVNIGYDTTGLYFERSAISEGTHAYKFCSIDDSHSVYIDNNLIATIYDSRYTSGVPGIDFGGNITIDNYLITTVDSNNLLTVPLLKQSDPSWGNKIYDSANIWSRKSPTISSWGCALTSAAMVFQYHGIKKLPNGSNLDPGTLNSWLKNQKDGYTRNGLVNWLSLTRLSKLAKNINSLTYDALEYIRKNTTDHSVLSSDINSGLPDILQEPGHFIVAKGINGSSYDINDPFYERTLLTDHYNNIFLSLGTYKPSNTNLSYIMLVVNNDINISLSGNNSTDGQIALQEYINDTQNDNKSTEQVNIFYLPKPTTGDYLIILNSNPASNFNLDIYSYDQDGNVFVSKKRGKIDQNGNASIPLKYKTPLYPKKVTYSSTILDLKKKNFIKHEMFERDLLQILIKAKVQNLLGNREKELFYLEGFIDLLSKYENFIPLSTYSNLVYDANYLSSDH